MSFEHVKIRGQYHCSISLYLLSIEKTENHLRKSNSDEETTFQQFSPSNFASILHQFFVHICIHIKIIVRVLLDKESANARPAHNKDFDTGNS